MRRAAKDYAIVRLDSHVGQAEVINISTGGIAIAACTLYDHKGAFWAIRKGTTLILSPRGIPVTVWGKVLRQDLDQRTLILRIDHCTDMDAWQAYCAGPEVLQNRCPGEKP